MNVSKVIGLAIAFAFAAALGLLHVSGCAPREPAPGPRAEVGGGGSLPPEVSVRPERSGEWPVAGGATLVLSADGRLALRSSDGEIALAAEALELPAISASGERIAFAARRADGFSTAVEAVAYESGAWTDVRALVDDGGTPDRVAISPDGSRVAFAAPAGGVAALWIVAFDGGAPVQLTNVGVRKQGPREPAGFVPVPHRGPPRFEGNELVWEAPDGTHRVVLP